ncbi:MAG: metallophosphoesterase [Ruminococcus sp.]|nr:metallophosphoesterase [Ruminococcus sp.]
MKNIILLVILFGLYVLIENRFMLRVRREKLGSGVRIAHVADLHKRRFGSNNERLCGKIAAEKPDIILVSGDIVSRSCTDFSRVGSLLRTLSQTAPVYLVFGNHETDFSPERRAAFIRAVKDSGTVLLENETVQLEINGRTLNLSGIELEKTVYKKNNSYRKLDVPDIEEFNEKLGKKPDGETVLLVHNPLFAELYAQWGADYAVTGHVHGGAVMIPFTGVGLLSPERKLLPKYSKGIYTVGKTKLLLSGGLGKFRLFNPPEIVIYEV